MKLWTVAAALPLIACSVGSHGEDSANAAPASGSGNARTFAVADFSAVDLRGFDDVDVKVGGGFSVRAEGPAEQLDRLVIEKRGDTLRIGRKSENGINWNSKGAKVAVFVTMPRISGASVAGSGDLTVDRAEAKTFDASVAGSGDLAVGALTTGKADISIAGSGSLIVAGTADRIDVSIAGSGDVDARKLTAKSADVSIVGSGGVTAPVDGPADVSIMGSGDVDLGPKARCDTTKMGSGAVKCG